MKLSKSDALFLHSFIFHALSSEHSGDVRVKLEVLMESLADSLLSSEETQDQEDEEEEEEESEEDEEEESEEDEEIEHDSFLSPVTIGKLPPASVTSPSGEKVSLQFEDVDMEGAVDALIDDGSVIINEVSTIKVTAKTVELHDGAEWHLFSYKKLPREWRVLKVNSTVGIE